MNGYFAARDTNVGFTHLAALGRQSPALTELAEAQREQAVARFRALRSNTERGAPLPRAAQAAGVGLRTVERFCLQLPPFTILARLPNKSR